MDQLAWRWRRPLAKQSLRLVSQAFYNIFPGFSELVSGLSGSDETLSCYHTSNTQSNLFHEDEDTWYNPKKGLADIVFIFVTNIYRLELCSSALYFPPAPLPNRLQVGSYFWERRSLTERRWHQWSVGGGTSYTTIPWFFISAKYFFLRLAHPLASRIFMLIHHCHICHIITVMCDIDASMEYNLWWGTCDTMVSPTTEPHNKYCSTKGCHTWGVISGHTSCCPVQPYNRRDVEWEGLCLLPEGEAVTTIQLLLFVREI